MKYKSADVGCEEPAVGDSVMGSIDGRAFRGVVLAADENKEILVVRVRGAYHPDPIVRLKQGDKGVAHFTQVQVPVGEISLVYRHPRPQMPVASAVVAEAPKRAKKG